MPRLEAEGMEVALMAALSRLVWDDCGPRPTVTLFELDLTGPVIDATCVLPSRVVVDLLAEFWVLPALECLSLS